MARAICKACGKVVGWRARRGSRMSELRCDCGGGLRGYREDLDPTLHPELRQGVLFKAPADPATPEPEPKEA